MTLLSNAIRSELISILADSEFHSGQTLADHFGISRTAVANHISALIDLGLDIYSVRGKGYRVATQLDLLSSTKINQLEPKTRLLPIEVLSVIDSTNAYLKEQINSVAHGHSVIAEAQTAGRGRRGRTWISPFAASVYISMCWRFQGGYQQIGGLSLFVGYCLIEALKELGVDGLAVKWPNDIYHQGRKLGGILVEVEGQIGTEVACIIGIGINVRLPENINAIDQPFSDLSSYDINRNQLCGSILSKLQQSLPEFERLGLAPIVNDWNAMDIFAKQQVTISGSHQQYQGISHGINTQGALQLKTDNGMVSINSGEVSLRAS